MNRFLIALFIFFSIFILSTEDISSQWFWQNPLPQSNYINSVKFADSLTGWITGMHGTVLKTTNKGENWNLLPLVTTDDLYGISVLNSQNIFIAAGYGKILKSSNGGTNWTIMKADTTLKIKVIHFINNLSGWVSGDSGYVQKTTNGGLNWSRFRIAQGLNAKSIFFYDSNTGWAGGSLNRLFKTTNGGANWDTVSINTMIYDISKVYFVDSYKGYFAARDKIFRTTDGGTTWEFYQYALSGSTFYCYDFTFINQYTGWFIISYSYLHGSGYWISRTSDGGHSFVDAGAQCTSPRTLTFVSPFSGFIISETVGIYRTTNAGQNYYNYISGFTDNISTILYAGNSRHFAATGSTIYISYDGGNLWFPNRNISELSHVFFPSASTGYAVGSNFVYKTSTGGGTWIPYATSASYLKRLFFINGNTGWMLGPSGRVLKTTNGALDWNVYLTGSTGGHSDIFFVNENTGWLTSSYSDEKYIYKSTDGGLYWKKYLFNTSGNNKIMNTLFFCSPDTGFAAGSGGYIGKTFNGGVNWIPVSSGTLSTINCIKFKNLQKGWAVGDSGTILYTKNSGLNWQVQLCPTGQNLYSLAFTDENVVWVAGNGGTILKTTNGGSVWIPGNNKNTPTRFSLSQNFPNPFNPVSKIKYQVPEFSAVNISVYDLTGRLVATLVDKRMAAGTYEAVFDGAGLSSGVYFCRITASDERKNVLFSDVKRMILVK